MTDPLEILAGRRGAVTFVAQRLGISAPAVSMWRHRGIPPKRLEAVCAALAAMDGEPGTPGQGAQPGEVA